MKKIAGNLGASIAGISVFALTVLVVVLFEHFTGFNVFTLSFFVIVPAGALLCGIGASGGYYFGALWFQTRPTFLILVQILAVAAIAQFAIYYGEYRLMEIEGTRVSDVIPFEQYLNMYLSSTHLRVGRGNIDTGEVGSGFGQLLAFLQFLGFIAGGVFVYLMLRFYPTCETCSRYLRTLAKRSQKFGKKEQFTQFYDTIFNVPVDGPQFAMLMSWDPEIGKVVKGTIVSESVLQGCPHCKTQRISQQVKVMGDKEFKEVPPLARQARIPDGIDLLPAFKGQFPKT